MDAAFNQEVFEYVLKILANHELIEGKSIGVKSTTLEANAALRSIVRRDNWQSYQDFLTDLAKPSWPSRSRRRRVKTSQNATENARTRGVQRPTTCWKAGQIIRRVGGARGLKITITGHETACNGCNRIVIVVKRVRRHFEGPSVRACRSGRRGT